jgi:hypothetical protein
MACLSIPHLLHGLSSDSQLGWVIYDLTGALHRIAIVFFFPFPSRGGVVLEYKEGRQHKKEAETVALRLYGTAKDTRNRRDRNLWLVNNTATPKKDRGDIDYIGLHRAIGSKGPFELTSMAYIVRPKTTRKGKLWILSYLQLGIGTPLRGFSNSCSVCTFVSIYRL